MLKELNGATIAGCVVECRETGCLMGLLACCVYFPLPGGCKGQHKIIQLFSIINAEEGRSLMRLCSSTTCTMPPKRGNQTSPLFPPESSSCAISMSKPMNLDAGEHQGQRIPQDSGKFGSLYPWYDSSAMKGGRWALVYYIVRLP